MKERAPHAVPNDAQDVRQNLHPCFRVHAPALGRRGRVVDEEQAGAEGLRYAASRELGVVVMELLRGGNLVRNVLPQVQRIWDESPLRRFPSSWAFRWLWNHPEVQVVPSGMPREGDLEDNVEAAEEGCPQVIGPAKEALYARVAEESRARMKVPCTAGMDIPECFNRYNMVFMFDSEKFARQTYPVFVEPERMAGQCEGCGAHDEKRPQNLPICNDLRDVYELLENEPKR